MTTEHNWPSGAVTFLFSDIEDSTPLWDRHRAAMQPALAEHDALLHDAAWPTIGPDRIRVRMGLHTGEADLHALIDWSYDLLDDVERWFLRQMAVFAGGWTLEAAEFVAESANSETGFLAKDTAAGNQSPKTRFLDAFELLANLVNKSLVRIDDSGDEIRYYYLETIRQYAGDRLYEAGEEAATILREDGSLPSSLADILYWQAILGVETGQAQGYEAARECYEIGRQLHNQVIQVVALASTEGATIDS